MRQSLKAELDAYKQAAKASRAEHTTLIDVVEFGTDGEPVRVYGKKPTIQDKSWIISESRTDRGHDDIAEQALRAVVRLAMDSEGNKLFDISHLQFLRTQVDAELIEQLAARLMVGASFELAKKNSPKTSTAGTSSASPNG